MVFQFLKKIFGGASEDGGGGGGGKAVTDGCPDGPGSKSQENGSSKAVVIEEEASQVSRTAEEAEALLTLNKWITLLDCFVGSWSEHLSKVQVMEALQERLLTVDPLTLGGDQCLPLVELKESSNVIDGGRYSKVTMVATVLEVGDLLLFNSIASEVETSRRKTLELAYDYLLELRDLISTFKKAFYFTGNDQLAIVETLATKNGKMFQRTEGVVVSGVGGNAFSASITLTNMAYFSEPSAPSKEAAARSVAHQACEYLRKIAQIGSAQLRNIYGSGSSNQGSSNQGTISSKTVAKAPKQIETPSAAAAAAVGVVDVVDGGKKNSSRVVPFTSTFSSAATAASTSAQASTSKASTSKVSTSKAVSPSSSALPEFQLTSSLTDPKLIARWALLLENFSSVSCEKKSKWQTRREMEAKGPREATIFVRPFRETIKLEEGVEVGAGVEKINGDKEGEVVLYWGIAEVAGLVKLRERGKDELDGKDNALTAMFRFLKLTIEMLRVFKRRHQTETGKTARGLVKALHGTYPALIEMKVEKKEVVEGEEGEGGRNSLPQKWTSRRLFTATIELLNVATFTATSSDKQAAREAASKALIELMFKMMDGGSGSGGGPASKVAGSGKPSLVEVAAPAAKKTAVPSSSFSSSMPSSTSASVAVDSKKKVDQVEGGQSTSTSVSPASKVFWNKSFTANADVLKAAKSPATGKQQQQQPKQPKQPTMTFSNGGGPAKKQAKKAGQKAYNPRKHQRFLLWQQKQQQLKLQQQEQQQEQQQLIQQQQQKNGGEGGEGGFPKNTSSAPTSSSSSTSAKKPDLEPSHLEVENEEKGGYEDDDEDEDECFGVEDLWIKFLDKVSVTSSSSSSSSLPLSQPPLLPLPTTLPTASSSSSAATSSPSPLLGFSPAPPPAPSSASEVVTTTTATAAAKSTTTTLQKSSSKKEEEKGASNSFATFAASIAPAYTEAQLREQLPAVVALIARYSDAVDKVPKRGRVFSPENIKEAFHNHLAATFSPPLEGGESLAWSILHWMQADGQELKTSLKTEEMVGKDGLLPSKHYLFTITIDCSAAGGCWPPPPLEFTFTGVSPAASGGLYLDQPEPPCREEAARAAVSWLADLANLLGQFTQLYIEKTGHLSAEKSRPLKNPATFIKELKKTLSNKAFLRMSPISKKVGKSGKNAHVYSCSVFLDRLVTFVGTGERSELAEANAAQKTVDMLLEMLRTNVVVKEEGY